MNAGEATPANVRAEKTLAQETAAIEVRALVKRYRTGTLANDGIDLSIRRGAVFALLGPNGAGKTTLVRQITGELASTSGQILVDGIDVGRHPTAAKARMGIVPQEAEPFGYMHIGEHLRFFGRLHGLDSRTATRRADELMTTLDLAKHANKMARELSGGTKRKLMVGIAAVSNPPILVLDEPTTGLDPHSRREVWALLADMRRAGTTILITTHYMDEAEVLSDEVAVIGAGRILARGTVDDLRGLSTNRYKGVYEDDNGRQEILGESQPAVVAELARRGVGEYSLSRTSLEDIYLEMTGARFGEASVA